MDSKDFETDEFIFEEVEHDIWEASKGKQIPFTKRDIHFKDNKLFDYYVSYARFSCNTNYTLIRMFGSRQIVVYKVKVPNDELNQWDKIKGEFIEKANTDYSEQVYEAYEYEDEPIFNYYDAELGIHY